MRCWRVSRNWAASEAVSFQHVPAGDDIAGGKLFQDDTHHRLQFQGVYLNQIAGSLLACGRRRAGEVVADGGPRRGSAAVLVTRPAAASHCRPPDPRLPHPPAVPAAGPQPTTVPIIYWTSTRCSQRESVWCKIWGPGEKVSGISPGPFFDSNLGSYKEGDECSGKLFGNWCLAVGYFWEGAMGPGVSSHRK